MLVPLATASAYTLKTLHSFCKWTNCNDGVEPVGGVLRDQSGNLYGTTDAGGKYSDGVVFKLVPNGDGTYKESVLHNFCGLNCAGGAGGKAPWAGLIMDVDGNLYGTTHNGGKYNDAGVIFKLTHATSGWSLTVLHNFCKQTNCTDGKAPQTALVMADSRHFFGTTPGGGAHGDGTAYELTHNMDGTWKYEVIYSFCSKTNCADGKQPLSDLIVDKDGRLYGTTYSGGAGLGTVYRLQHTSTGWTENLTIDFCTSGACKLGRSPDAGLSYAGQSTGAPWDESSPLFGTTSRGGKKDHGVVFRLVHASGWTFTRLHSFDVGIGPGALLV
ncbi:MAG: choice-of-anchor tandem repeat GloVer-containing protein, partial [Thermoanaerobaculia bacterium]